MSETFMTDADKKYWGPQPPVLNYLLSQIKPTDLVLELGPGHTPFERANKYVDWIFSDAVPRDLVAICDMNRDRLPFEDKSFDFAYCRHTIEDMHNPFLLCSEMMRVAKAGYIETPSPISELCRGVDGGSPGWRGYIHHHYLVWENEGTLQFVAKYPAIEYLKAEIDKQVLDLLRAGPKYWNTYFLWNDNFPVKYLQHDVDYLLQKNYSFVLLNAIQQSIRATDRFAARMTGHSRVTPGTAPS